MHDVELALLGRLDQRRPVHLLRARLKSDLLGDIDHELAVGAAELAVLDLGHRHVAVHADGELARRHGLDLGAGEARRRHHNGGGGSESGDPRDDVRRPAVLRKSVVMRILPCWLSFALSSWRPRYADQPITLLAEASRICGRPFRCAVPVAKLASAFAGVTEGSQLAGIPRFDPFLHFSVTASCGD